MIINKQNYRRRQLNMQNISNNINSNSNRVPLSNSSVSLKPLLTQLQQLQQSASEISKSVITPLIKAAESLNEDLISNQAMDTSGKALMQSIIEHAEGISRNEQSRAISAPFSNEWLFKEEAFEEISSNNSKKEDHTILLMSLYNSVLSSCYDMENVFAVEETHTLEQKGVQRFYKIRRNHQFVELHIDGHKPELSSIELYQFKNSTEKLQYLMQLIPIDQIQVSGLDIVVLEDITVDHCITSVKSMIISQAMTASPDFFETLSACLQSLIGSAEIKFGLIPKIFLNEKPVYGEALFPNSILIKAATRNKVPDETYQSWVSSLFAEGSNISIKKKESADINALLQKEGIEWYEQLPLFYNERLVGVLEIFSSNKSVDASMLQHIEPVLPLIGQLVQSGIRSFYDGIEKVVQEQFTSIQPSVQWKFNEVAWQYMRDLQQEGRTEIQEIEFKDVYPLYGAIDIRNSTIERSKAMNRDLQIQFNSLIGLLHELSARTQFVLLEEKIFTAQKWLDEINATDECTQQLEIGEFLENNILPFLLDFKTRDAEVSQLIDQYLKIIDEKKGQAYENRRQLERSMKMVISAVSNYIDKVQREIQQTYPAYFEKFRTDGVEYDIYIGQSICPETPYSDIYLKNLRLLQLQSMAHIARFTASMRERMPVPIETTQLIFLHSQSIDIKFRKDEKRFDVEGAYNIRYHVVKKRIDKVNLLGVEERLTQPGKIAIVYSNPQDATEYTAYIDYLKGQGVLLDDTEFLDLEELQGVNGLKAIRVGVNLEEQEQELRFPAMKDAPRFTGA